MKCQVSEFLSRFANIPDMLELDHLTVSGDVTFGRNVALRVRHPLVVYLECILCNKQLFKVTIEKSFGLISVRSTLPLLPAKGCDFLWLGRFVNKSDEHFRIVFNMAG